MPFLCYFCIALKNFIVFSYCYPLYLCPIFTAALLLGYFVPIKYKLILIPKENVGKNKTILPFPVSPERSKVWFFTSFHVSLFQKPGFISIKNHRL